MVAKKVHLRIITPREIKLDEQVDMVIMRCISGDMGVMPNHEARSAVLDYGLLRILNDNAERKIAVFSGLAKMKNNMLSVLTYDAEWPDDIDRTRAELDRERAERRLREKTDDLEIQSDQILLRRSLVRLEVSSYATLYEGD